MHLLVCYLNSKLISVPSPAIKTQLLPFNKTQSKVVTGLFTGHNTLRRHLYVMGLSSNCSCRKCGTEGRTSVHILCMCEALASLRHANVGSFFLDPEDITNLKMGAIGTIAKEQGSCNLVIDHGAQRVCFKV